jgi:VanZ family protein
MTDGRLTCAAWLRAGKTRYKGQMSRFMPPPSVLRACAWFCVALIAVLSLIPDEMEARTGLPGKVEHLISYAGTAGLLRLGYPSWVGWRIVAALFVYAGCLEVLQGFVPGRSPSLDGALASGAGAILGAIAAAWRGRRGQDDPTRRWPT